ncbi:hypothetical protein [Marinoscillum sp.]|uniref:hypothetical protein n=1 Tax=Marinoscillum sp. TaxID=2024838 RepID=UPI003BA9AF8B
MKIALMIVGLAALVLTVSVVTGPDRFLKGLVAEQIEPVDESLNHSRLDSIVHVLAYKEALLELSKQDSIQLVLDLKASAVYLTIHGVPVFQSLISEQELDAFLNKFSNGVYRKVFQKPLPVAHTYATIVKEPVIEQQAPKTPEEAMAVAYMPDTIQDESVYLYLELANGIGIGLEQSNRHSLTDLAAYLKYKKEVYLRRWSNHWDHKWYQYQPEITARLPKEDLKAIYRALSDSPQVVVYY